ncbi:MAG: diacylglycerol kinase [Armatimonadota bacterium]|nr:diacylglycerol kinase [Armatimonadota bacterium]MDW8155211.1 diacylglycerol kinase [Armatimonadota bacterium]
MNRTVGEAFRAAGLGLTHAWRTQRNFRLQCAVAAAVLAAALWVDASAVEVAVLFLACGLVLALELANTAVELLVDGLWPHRSEVAGRVKDVSAAAVVVAAAAAAGVGAVVLGPPLLARAGLHGAWVKVAVAGVGALAAAAAATWRALGAGRLRLSRRPEPW